MYLGFVSLSFSFLSTSINNNAIQIIQNTMILTTNKNTNT